MSSRGSIEKRTHPNKNSIITSIAIRSKKKRSCSSNIITDDTKRSNSPQRKRNPIRQEPGSNAVQDSISTTTKTHNMNNTLDHLSTIEQMYSSKVSMLMQALSNEQQKNKSLQDKIRGLESDIKHMQEDRMNKKSVGTTTDELQGGSSVLVGRHVMDSIGLLMGNLMSSKERIVGLAKDRCESIELSVRSRVNIGSNQ